MSKTRCLAMSRLACQFAFIPVPCRLRDQQAAFRSGSGVCITDSLAGLSLVTLSSSLVTPSTSRARTGGLYWNIP